MEMVDKYLSSLSSDQKRFLGLGILIFLLLIIYGVSKSTDINERIVDEPTKEAFKGGDLVSNNTSEYYRNRGENIAKQYEDVKSSQKILEDQLKEIKIELEKSRLAADQNKNPVTEEAQNIAGTTVDFNNLGDMGKKMIR